MKHHLSILAAAVLLTGTPWAAAQIGSFTYQGRLEDGGQPFSGLATIRMSLFSQESGGTALATQTFTAINPTNGLFTVTFTQAGPGIFDGSNRWVQIEVSSNAGVNYTTLAPRQPVTATPYAMRASKADDAASLNGVPPSGYLRSSGSSTLAGTLTLQPPGGAPAFLVPAGSPQITNLNVDLLDGLDSTAFVRKSGDTMSGTLVIPGTSQLDFGSAKRQQISLWNAGEYGIGMQDFTFYQRANRRFSWFLGGTPVTTENDPGSGGKNLLSLIDSELQMKPGAFNSVPGQGPIRMTFGDSTLAGLPYVSVGEADDDDVMDLVAKKIRIRTNSSGTDVGGLDFGQLSGETIRLWSGGSDDYGIGIQTGTQYFRTGHNFAWFKGGVHAGGTFDPGAGGSSLMTLDETGVLRLLASSGRLETPVLTITGGSDVAEPFEVTPSEEEVPAGSVMVIDPAHPGRLKLSDTPFDTKVAGVVSGANGVNPGLTLRQKDVLDGSHIVALTGRVYVRAEAESGAIEPGDLLTTSNTPGHAMKVTSHDRAQGAILGKAMTSLDHGAGFVLVLVTLQ